MTNCSNFTS